MGALLPEPERLILDDIERRLRRQDPGLDRRLRHRHGPLRALAWRPGVLVAAVGVLTAAAAAGVLWAAAGGRAAVVPAAGVAT
ncbi:DUF3040 domain-containing protein, partial [Kitasatospora paranensis]